MELLTYTDNQVKEIVARGSFADWEDLEKNLTLDLCKQVKTVCKPFLEGSSNLPYVHWFSAAVKFENNTSSRKNLENRYDN